MLKSTESLRRTLTGPLGDCCGPEAELLKVEIHGEEVRGTALCPGKIVKFVLDAQSRRLKTEDILKVAKPRISMKSSM